MNDRTENTTDTTDINSLCQLAWMQRGYNRRRLNPHSKTPAGLWQVIGPDEPVIEGSWGAIPPPGVLILDVDVKGKDDGLASLARLEADFGDLSDTLQVLTPSGGLHIYLQIPEGIHTKGKVPGYPGIDLRGPYTQHYVCGPGSDLDGKVYAPLNNEYISQPFLAAPRGLVDLVAKSAKESLNPDQAFYDDTPQLRARFRSFAEKYFEQNGDDNRFNLMCRAADLGLDPDAAEEVANECGFTRVGLRERTNNAYRMGHRETQIGSLNPKSVFTVIPMTEAEVEREQKRRGFFIDFTELGKRKPDWLVEGYFETNSVNMVAGAPSSYKSFLVMDWALSIAHGVSWHGKRVKKQKVLYIAGEGQAGIGNRRLAWHAARNVKPEAGQIFASEYSLPLPGHIDDLIDRIGFISENFKPGIIVLDTLNRTMEGDENSATDFAAFLQSLDKLRACYPGAAIVIVHHFGKDHAKGLRGSSAILGGMDAVYELHRSETGYSSTLKCRKIKDGDEPDDMLLKLRVLQLGDDITSCVLERTFTENSEDLVDDNGNSLRQNDAREKVFHACDIVSKKGHPVTRKNVAHTMSVKDLTPPQRKYLDEWKASNGAASSSSIFD